MTAAKFLLLFQLIKTKLTNFSLNLTNYTKECKSKLKNKIILQNNFN